MSDIPARVIPQELRGKGANLQNVVNIFAGPPSKLDSQETLGDLVVSLNLSPQVLPFKFNQQGDRKRLYVHPITESRPRLRLPPYFETYWSVACCSLICNPLGLRIQHTPIQLCGPANYIDVFSYNQECNSTLREDTLQIAKLNHICCYVSSYRTENSAARITESGGEKEGSTEGWIGPVASTGVVRQKGG